MQITKASSAKQPMRSWRKFLPLYLAIIMLLVIAAFVSFRWHDFLLQSALWQKELHQQLVKLLQQVQPQPLKYGALLMLFSFVYGLLHSAGPGHGKMIIASYLATHPLKLKASLLLTLAASLLQGVAAIVLVTLVLSVFQLSARVIHQSSFWLEQGSYLFIVLIGVILCYRAISQLLKVIKANRRAASFTIHSLTPLKTDHVHSNSCDCGCGHRHLPTPNELSASGDWKTNLAIIFSIGMRPCSGAILVLLFAKVIDIYYWGMAAAMVMALGTATTISLLALLVYLARNAAEKLITRSHRSSLIWQRIALSSLSLIGGALLILFGIILYYASTPAVSGGLRFLGV
ncbi:MAG: nickel/cobalt transporter [Enterobacteriaceae bacterium]|jgi:ABC-type nickel/cobalt efflux system permease component RcnA|nr:nickel/cobalt transporter [Enterobacteriaceae bacterium]